jgi:hypothetical protein
MAEYAYCPNGHSVALAGAGTVCTLCGAPLYTRCPYGHSMWLSQTRCPTCGATVGTTTGDWPPHGSAPQMSSVQLPAESQMLADGVLRPGERLLWAGQPDPSVRFTKADGFLVPFSILWGGFAVFWEVGVVASGGPPFFALWGIPFVAMGFYFTVGRFIWKARRKRRTIYLLTDQRAVTMTTNGQLSEAPWRGTPKQVSRHRDGQHVDVVFDSPSSMRWPFASQAAMYANTGMDFFIRRPMGVAFFDVADRNSLLAALGQPGF